MAENPSSTTPRADPNSPYPTTFVHADTSSFKRVVQMLTGSADTARVASTAARAKTPSSPYRKEKPSNTSRLYERRISSNFSISPLAASGPPPPAQIQSTPAAILSPSLLDFPALVLSPVTPLNPDPFNRNEVIVAEEKAIQEKRFYLHPSPANTPRESEPRLLPLFPLSSPRGSS